MTGVYRAEDVTLVVLPVFWKLDSFEYVFDVRFRDQRITLHYDADLKNYFGERLRNFPPHLSEFAGSPRRLRITWPEVRLGSHKRVSIGVALNQVGRVKQFALHFRTTVDADRSIFTRFTDQGVQCELALDTKLTKLITN